MPVAITTGMSMKAGQSTKTGMSMKAGMSTKTGQSVKSKAMTIGIEGKTSDDAWEEEIMPVIIVKAPEGMDYIGQWYC